MKYNYTIKEIENICSRYLAKDDKNIKHFVAVFNCYNNKNDEKKLKALAIIFNQCFSVERQWFYDKSVDESKLIGYEIIAKEFPEMVSIILENQYQKITKIIFEEENKNLELQDSISELEN